MQNASNPPIQTSMGSPATAPAGPRDFPFAFALSIALALLAGLLLRWRGLGSESLWWDEGFTLWFSKFSPADIWRALRLDTAPPLFYILEHFWTKPFGASDESLRALSAFFETLSLPLFFLLAKNLLAEKKAVALAMWLFALSTFQVMYAREARFYALLSFISLATLFCLLRFLERRSAFHFLSIVFLIAAGLYTHNLMFFYLPAIAAVWLIYPSLRTPLHRMLELSIAAVLVLLLYLPWLSSLFAQINGVSRSFWVPKPTPRSLLETLCVLSGFELDYLSSITQRLFQLSPEHSSWLVLFSAFLIFTICLVGGLLGVLSSNQRKCAAIMAYALLPILLVFLASRVSTSVYLNRAFIASSAVLPILYCAPVAFQAGARSKLYSLLTVITLFTIAISLFGYLRYHVKEDWRGMTRYSSEIQNGPRLIAFVPYQGQILYDHYAIPGPRSGSRAGETGLPTPFDFENPIQPYPTPFPDRGMFESFFRRIVESRQYQEVDIVISHTPARISRPIEDFLNAQCDRVAAQDFSEIRFVRCMVPAHGVMDR